MKENIKNITSRLTINNFIQLLSKHPYLTVIVAILLLTPICFGEKIYITLYSTMFITIIALWIAFFLIIICNNDKDRGFSFALFFVIGCIICFIAALAYIQSFDAAWIFFPSVIFLSFLAFILYKNDRLNTKTLCMLIIISGIILRLCYVLYTNSGQRQHDVGYFNWTGGHSYYIEYWYNNGLKLPDFDVRTIWQFYHPPLHHLIMACFLKILTTLSVEYEKACEALQILPLMYSSLCMIASYKIFRSVKLKGLGLIIAISLIAFHPTFIIFAGSYNNDILCTLFILLAIVAALKWYKESTTKNIICLALCIGLGMMTKLSAWMIAPAVAFLFLVVLIKNIKNFWKYFLQFTVFAVICFPLALWWQIRNYIAFDVPITYIPNLGVHNFQYVGNIPTILRLFDFSEKLINPVYVNFNTSGYDINDYNPLISLFKTATFDEGAQQINDINFPQISITGPVLFWLSVVVFLIAAIAFVYFMCFKVTNIDREHRIFFIIIFAIYIVSYYSFCFAYPHVCTQNIRYCIPLIVLSAMGMGLLIQHLNSDSLIMKTLRYALVTLSCLFCFATSIVYTQIG